MDTLGTHYDLDTAVVDKFKELQHMKLYLKSYIVSNAAHAVLCC